MHATATPTLNLITVAQAAKKLRVSPQRVRKLIADGRLPSALVNPRLRLIDPAALADLKPLRRGRPGKAAEKQWKPARKKSQQITG